MAMGTPLGLLIILLRVFAINPEVHAGHTKSGNGEMRNGNEETRKSEMKK